MSLNSLTCSSGRFSKAFIGRRDFHGARPHSAHVRHGPNFDDGAVLQTWALLSDSDRFVFVGDFQVEVTTNRFFRLGERTVGDSATVPARNNFAFVLQWVPAFAFSFLHQP